MWGKVMLFETCDRVPLIIRVPESIKKGATTAGSSADGIVELIDLYPTLADLCGVSPPLELQGRILTSMLEDSTTKGKEVAYTVVSRGKELGKAIRTQRYRYTLWPTGEELYDLSTDSQEEQNLANSAEHSERLEKLREQLARIEKKAAQKKR
jgi:iduronate 2-sulfatase